MTTRALVIYQDHAGTGSRAIVSIASVMITILFYLALRWIGTTKLWTSIIVAAVLAAPAAISYAAINWYVFSHSWVQPQPRRVVVMAGEGGPGTGHAPTMITVGKMSSDDNMAPVTAIADQAANGYFFFVCWAALYLALCYAAEIGALERRAAALKRAAQSAELRALRYQVNPHFLFNTLNSLSSLVMTDRKAAAERMIVNLSTFFRNSLTADPTEDVPLDDEIRLQQLYLDIEAERFPERLAVRIDVDEDVRKACVPGLILQPLVENAVKHGVSRARTPVTLRIRAYREGVNLVVLVDNDGDTRGVAPAQGTGVGLRNVRERLAARFGDEAKASWATIPGGGFAVRLEMPLIHNDC
nr:histidine kinase [Sphingomonas vulcanisoli]